jgi:regulator-associated protein of mTOR
MEAAASQLVSDTLVLCATSENEWLPMHPDYPADIFTSCLTTPIQMALRWFVRCNPQSMGGLSPETVDAIPGKSNDRKTPLGELTWIFAAVTDSIAWNVLPRPLFQRLFRQDLLVAGMFRNFLLADRILKSLNCSPQSYPPLPPGVCDHPLWEAWDLACETCLYGLMRDGILTNRVVAPVRDSTTSDDEESAESAPSRISLPTKPVATVPVSSVSSPFFSEQLSAFEIWLDFASIHKASPSLSDTSEPFESPEQLPIVLQVLLTPVYRIQALMLLRRFLDLGPWAVNLALSLGILPYVTKLLQSPEYKQNLMGIWAKILAFDPSCQQIVLKEGGLPHFISHLTWGIDTALIAIPVDPKEAAIQRTMAAFILAATCLDFPRGQAECIRLNLHGTCCSLLSSFEFADGDELDSSFQARLSIAESRVPPVFRTWLCLCLGCLVNDNAIVQSQALGAGVQRRLLARLRDDNANVRAAACYALGCILGSTRSKQDSTSSPAGGSQQSPVNFPVVGGSAQASLSSNRLMSPPVGAGSSGRVQPTFTPGPTGYQTLRGMPQGPMGVIPQQSVQLPQVQPHIQQAVYSPDAASHTSVGGSGLGILSTGVGGRPMDGSYLGRPQSSLMSPQFVNNPSEHRLQERSVFEDERRIVYDTSVTDGTCARRCFGECFSKNLS